MRRVKHVVSMMPAAAAAVVVVGDCRHRLMMMMLLSWRLSQAVPMHQEQASKNTSPLQPRTLTVLMVVVVMVQVLKVKNEVVGKKYRKQLLLRKTLRL
jgi:hypothetical protein